jgi:endoglucanase
MSRSRSITISLILAVVVALAGTTLLAQAGKFSLRVNAGATAEFTDRAGNTWQPDKAWRQDGDYGFSGGDTIDRGKGLAIDGTEDDRLYQTERYQMDRFVAKVPNGTYTVRLHFAETYEDIEFDGPRIFDVTIEGKPVLEKFDVQKTAGARNKALVQEFTGIAVADGEITLEFVSRQQNAMVNGIEILGQ